MYEAGEGVKNARCLPGVKLVSAADVAGNGAGSQDGDGVVSGAEVGQTDQGGDAQFGAPFTTDATGQLFYQV